MRVAVLGTGMVGRAIAGKLSELGHEVGDHTVFASGDITTARGPEMLMALWLRPMGSLQTPMFNVKVVR